MFQSTHPRGVRPTRWSWTAPAASGFNPRTRVGCDAVADAAPKEGDMFQSTHPRGVRPPGLQQDTQHRKVSIHAPAWGATPRSDGRRGWRLFQSTHPRGVRPKKHQNRQKNEKVSIHAPAWGATRWCLAHLIEYKMFQSTHPRGVRHIRCAVFMLHSRVSIHAPAWGATSGTWPQPWARSGFNPRTRVGCDCFHVLSSRFP